MEKMSITYPGSSGQELADKGHISQGNVANYDATYYKPKKEVIMPMKRIEAKPIANVIQTPKLVVQTERSGGITECNSNTKISSSN